MKKLTKRASIFVYILLLINISLMLAYIVYNNTFIIDNNLNIGKNNGEIYSFIYDKGHINLEADRKYNTDGRGFNDLIICPTGITMSGSTYIGIVDSYITYDKGEIYCKGIYRGEEFRIYFNETSPAFLKQAYFTGSTVDINYTIPPSQKYNISINSYLDVYPSLLSYSPENSIDTNMDTYYLSKNGTSKWIKYDLGGAKKIKNIKLRKINTSTNYWRNGKLEFYNSSDSLVFSSNIINLNTTTQKDVYTYTGDYSSAPDIRYVRLITTDSTNKYLDVANFEIWSLESDVPVYTSSGTFDYDNTKMTFASGSTLDDIDDDFNSDDYKPSSTGSIVYPDGFQDNDDDARKTIFGNVSALSNLYNIFWNNFKTNDFIEKNTNNSGTLNLNIGSSTGAYLYLDLYAFSGSLKYDLKILEFDRDAYKNKYTLLPKASYIGKNLVSNEGYIGNSGSLLLQTSTGSNSFVFDFKNKDYAIFITNNQNENLSYRITGVDKYSSKRLYINPIDDSDPTIRSLSNHMFIGNERNFIGEHITVVGNK